MLSEDESSLSPSLALELLLAYKERPGIKNSWATVFSSINNYVRNNDGYLSDSEKEGIHLLSSRKLANWYSRGTIPKPKALSLIFSFIRSTRFQSVIPEARSLFKEKSLLIQDGRTLAKYFGFKHSNTAELFDGIVGDWAEDLAFFRPQGQELLSQYDEYNGENFDEVFSIFRISLMPDESFCTVHRCTQLVQRPIFSKLAETSEVEKVPRVKEEQYARYMEIYKSSNAKSLSIPESGFVFLGERPYSYRMVLYSRLTGYMVLDKSFSLDLKNGKFIDIKYDEVVGSSKSISQTLGDHYSKSLSVESITDKAEKWFAEVKWNVVIDES